MFACPADVRELVPCLRSADPPASCPTCCAACLPADVPALLHAHAGHHEHPRRQVHVHVISPPDWGSTATVGLLSSSPAVGTMCSNRTHYCEATHELVRQGIFTISERNDPSKTDWAKAWPIMTALYDRPDAPVLVEKQPCNLGKAATLRAHLERLGLDYRFIVLRRQPCMMKAFLHRTLATDAEQYGALLLETPPERVLVVDFEELATRPDAVARRLLDFLPQLTSLRLDETRVPVEGKHEYNSGRDLPALAYTRSAFCSLHMQARLVNATHMRWLGFDVSASTAK